MFRVGPNKKDDYGKSADENLAKWLNDKYGEENWKKGPNSEYNKFLNGY